MSSPGTVLSRVTGATLSRRWADPAAATEVESSIVSAETSELCTATLVSGDHATMQATTLRTEDECSTLWTTLDRKASVAVLRSGIFEHIR